MEQQAMTSALPVAFEVEGQRYSLAEMLAANSDDVDVCEWAKSAKAGEFFPGVVRCDAVAA